MYSKILFLTLLIIQNIICNPVHYPISINGKHYDEIPDHIAVQPSGNVDNKKVIEVGIHAGAYTCGGTVIGHKYILTAAHCVNLYCTKVNEIKPENFTVFAEGTCIDNNNPCDNETKTREIQVKKYYWPKGYLKNCSYDDLAILELEEKLDTEGATLYTDDDIPSNGTFFSSGYGFDPLEPTATAHLLKTVELEAKECKTDDKTIGYYDSMCTVEIDKDVCRGDSGSGLKNKNDVIYGIVSSGISCKILAENQKEGKSVEYDGGIFTAVNKHLDFICRIIGVGNSGCKKEFITNKEEIVTSED